MTYRCPICQKHIKEDDAVTIYCSHVFDRDCVEKQPIGRMFSCPICHQISSPEDIAPLFDENKEDGIMETIKEKEAEDEYKIKCSKIRQSEDQLESLRFEKEQLLTKLHILVKQYISTEKQRRSLKKHYFEESDFHKKDKYCKGYYEEKSRQESQRRHLTFVVGKIDEVQHNYRALLNKFHTFESLDN